MTMIRSRTFCCCIPVRVGVVLVALFGLLGGGTLAIVGASQAHRIGMPTPAFSLDPRAYKPFPDGSKVSIAISITVYALLAFLSLLGLVGAIGRKISLIKMYFGMLVAHLVFSIGIGAFALHRVFSDSMGFYDECMLSQPASQVEDPSKLCKDGAKILKGVSVTVFIIFWLFEIWGCLIVGNYSKQLQDENALSGVVKDTEAW
ncbi:hypothetical protein BDZ94DRAFT_1318710 [Collybia nuda]|uniref:Uncharacterized protein n=1 Tax=Collybia nuda TaxID=64659 RepID=A0A9P6CMG0_9AGAR|nr:hypothetical protein BDZ94DRAFT_1318710 [Collybia nuda]